MGDSLLQALTQLTAGHGAFVWGAALLLLVLAATLAVARRGGSGGERDRHRLEHAAKELHHLGGRATPAALAGALGVPLRRLGRLMVRLEEAGLARVGGDEVTLTRRGKAWAASVVRAHRLYELYLADEARMSLEGIHKLADRREHELSPADIERLDAHLGHPEHDPHGEPIPGADGSVGSDAAVHLRDWPVGKPCRIARVEGLTDETLRRLLARGFLPGAGLLVTERQPNRVRVAVGGAEVALDHVVAAGVHVVETGLEHAGLKPLSEVPRGALAEIVELDGRCRGFTRRRLLDLGLTPGARITPEVRSLFGDTRGYRVRGTLVALRGEQANWIWVRPARTRPSTKGGA